MTATTPAGEAEKNYAMHNRNTGYFVAERDDMTWTRNPDNFLKTTHDNAIDICTEINKRDPLRFNMEPVQVMP